ncbi:2156af56-60de-4431-81d5-ca79ac8cd4e7 [Sclerotinia trifoliorum]|uniref:Riboflavin kinase n=1 Tax=Sclerotinia trifoliorum TaxID=28548 RepID=A0A8H2W269_9HELO|nr:2156af56-60de-4431-81d5-ca79ac8cd4e7 [Sclerotinia trifoliorum]
MSTKEPRPQIIGPESGPEPPYPLRMQGEVVSGFGRGSKELGIPTANLPVTNVPWIDTAPSGVYFGYAALDLPTTHPDLKTSPSPSSSSSPTTRLYPMVMSIGYNPFYRNSVRSAEVHLLHTFTQDFYGSQMRVKILGYIRPELDYVDRESLVRDIETDIEVARTSLGREAWGVEKEGVDGWLLGLEGDGKEN